MDIRKDVYGLEKEALVDSFVNATTGIASGVGQLGAMGAVYLLAATALTGIGIGAVGAKMTAHGDLDIDTAKKMYENERLKADLGYLSGKVKTEYEAFKNKQAPKAARVLG